MLYYGDDFAAAVMSEDWSKYGFQGPPPSLPPQRAFDREAFNAAYDTWLTSKDGPVKYARDAYGSDETREKVWQAVSSGEQFTYTSFKDLFKGTYTGSNAGIAFDTMGANNLYRSLFTTTGEGAETLTTGPSEVAVAQPTTPAERIYNAIVTRYGITITKEVSDLMDAETSLDAKYAVFTKWLGETNYAAATAYQNFDNLLYLLTNNQLEGDNGFYASCQKLVESGYDWMVDGLELGKNADGMAGAPTSDSIFGILKDFDATQFGIVSAAWWQKETDMKAATALTLQGENDRINRIQSLFGHDKALTADDLLFIRTTSTMTAQDILAHPDMAPVYFALGAVDTDGMNIVYNQAKAKWQEFAANSDLPVGLRAQYADFDSLWNDYQIFSSNAILRATKAESNADVLGVDEVVPYNYWTFDEYLEADAAMTAVKQGWMLGDESTSLTSVGNWFQDQGITGLAPALLVQAPGESYVDYKDRVTAAFGQDMWDILAANAQVDVAPTEVIQMAMPAIMSTIESTFLPKVAPGQRAGFLEELRAYIMPSAVNPYASSLWGEYERIYGPISGTYDKTGSWESSQNAINEYAQGFVNWAAKQDFFQSKFGADLPALQEQLKNERKAWAPTRTVTQPSFGLGR